MRHSGSQQGPIRPSMAQCGMGSGRTMGSAAVTVTNGVQSEPIRVGCRHRMAGSASVMRTSLLMLSRRVWR